MSLRVDNLVSGYGSLEVLHGVDFEVASGHITAMLGSNGAGKSTTLLTLAGMLPAWRGGVELHGKPLAGMSPRARCRSGLVLVPEGRRVFASVAVEANLRLGAWAAGVKGVDAEKSLARVYERFPRLGERRAQAAGTLSGGEQQMLAIGRGLMAHPRVLLVDECSLGLSPVMVAEVFRVLAAIAAEGMAVLVVEQNVSVLDYAAQAIVIEQGQVEQRAAGAGLKSLARTLRESYLGRTAVA